MSIEHLLLVGAGNNVQPEGQENLKDTAQTFCQFVSQTKSTLHIAAYHFKFFGDVAQQIRQALTEVASRAEVKIAYFDEPKRAYSGHQRLYGGDQSGPSVFEGYERTRVQLKAIESIDIHSLPEGVAPAPIEGDGALMHSKYMIRDDQDVWMGTANFTEDGWGLQDNNILIFTGEPELARYYATDFDELWQYGRIAGTGKNDNGNLTVSGDSLEVDFSPGDGISIDQRIADLISGATRSIHVASMDISSALILEALAEAIKKEGVEVTGVYDGPQMTGVEKAWARGNGSSQKAAWWDLVKTKLVAKQSRPFNPGDANGFYNFMHNKTLVVDESIVHTGSFNFSSNARRNAENVVNLKDAQLAKAFADYIGELVKRYRG
ncbi:hypothetical protein FAZ69_16655 [Trinickia terrae]|uniref:phospholipase D n=1 Tax=Trinickia terrae TaxID=2571161 RepID=A0A4U1I3S4_9BURK|nr:phospholipase D-like domain-containing protein [Trinickia terrae]TKC87897.1 hypothetical protein FAZ69_16655 [Trinickia terrae]